MGKRGKQINKLRDGLASLFAGVSYPDELFERFLAELMACNAADGSACDLPGIAEMRKAMLTAFLAFQRDQPTGTGAQFLDYLKAECLGEPDLPLAPARPDIPPFAKLADFVLDTPLISTVVTLPSFLKLLSEEDKENFERNWSLRFTASGASGGADLTDDLEEKLGTRLARLPATARLFRIAPDESHGRPYVWFTTKEDVQRFFDLRKGTGMTHADIARDALGLVHHGPKAYRSDRANHLVALHFPAAIAERAGHLRPSAVQAFTNRRFVQQFDMTVRTTATDWGRTLELYLFRTVRSAAPIGCRERLLLRLQQSLLDPSERIAFDYLGKVTSLRGDVPGIDCDDSFIRLVARGRDPQAEVRAMCR